VIVKDVIKVLEYFAPTGYQESYDNIGLLVGSPDASVSGILVCLDITPKVVDESLAVGANLIVSHHPIIFTGLKRLNGKTSTEQTIIKAIENGVALYAAHTNVDSVWNGLNHRLAQLFKLTDLEILAPASDQLVKLITFAPHDHAQAVRDAMFVAGAGNIGDYSNCSYNIEGYGTFKGEDESTPFVGKKGETHIEPETRIEVVVPKPLLPPVLKSMLTAHPYQEVAYDIIPILNKNPRAGLGMVGNLSKPEPENDFLGRIKEILGTGCIKHSALTGKLVSRVALCGGSGGSLIDHAINHKANVYVTSDLKYHNFIDASSRILLADVGHFESEKIAVDIFYELLTKKMPNFAVLKSKVNTNPINYI